MSRRKRSALTIDDVGLRQAKAVGAGLDFLVVETPKPESPDTPSLQPAAIPNEMKTVVSQKVHHTAISHTVPPPKSEASLVSNSTKGFADTTPQSVSSAPTEPFWNIEDILPTSKTDVQDLSKHDLPYAPKNVSAVSIDGQAEPGTVPPAELGHYKPCAMAGCERTKRYSSGDRYCTWHNRRGAINMGDDSWCKACGISAMVDFKVDVRSLAQVEESSDDDDDDDEWHNHDAGVNFDDVTAATDDAAGRSMASRMQQIPATLQDALPVGGWLEKLGSMGFKRSNKYFNLEFDSQRHVCLSYGDQNPGEHDPPFRKIRKSVPLSGGSVYNGRRNWTRDFATLAAKKQKDQNNDRFLGVETKGSTQLELFAASPELARAWTDALHSAILIASSETDPRPFDDAIAAASCYKLRMLLEASASDSPGNYITHETSEVVLPKERVQEATKSLEKIIIKIQDVITENPMFIGKDHKSMSACMRQLSEIRSVVESVMNTSLKDEPVEEMSRVSEQLTSAIRDLVVALELIGDVIRDFGDVDQETEVKQVERLLKQLSNELLETERVMMLPVTTVDDFVAIEDLTEEQVSDLLESLNLGMLSSNLGGVSGIALANASLEDLKKLKIPTLQAKRLLTQIEEDFKIKGIHQKLINPAYLASKAMTALRDLSEEEVSSLLKSMKFGQYVDNLAGVDGKTLERTNSMSDLVEVGMNAVDARKFIDKLDRYRQDGVPPAPPQREERAKSEPHTSPSREDRQGNEYTTSSWNVSEIPAGSKSSEQTLVQPGYPIPLVDLSIEQIKGLVTALKLNAFISSFDDVDGAAFGALGMSELSAIGIPTLQAKKLVTYIKDFRANGVPMGVLRGEPAASRGLTPLSELTVEQVSNLFCAAGFEDVLENFAGIDGRTLCEATIMDLVDANIPFAVSERLMKIIDACRNDGVPAASICSVDGVPVGDLSDHQVKKLLTGLHLGVFASSFDGMDGAAFASMGVAEMSDHGIPMLQAKKLVACIKDFKIKGVAPELLRGEPVAFPWMIPLTELTAAQISNLLRAMKLGHMVDSLTGVDGYTLSRATVGDLTDAKIPTLEAKKLIKVIELCRTVGVPTTAIDFGEGVPLEALSKQQVKDLITTLHPHMLASHHFEALDGAGIGAVGAKELSSFGLSALQAKKLLACIKDFAANGVPPESLRGEPAASRGLTPLAELTVEQVSNLLHAMKLEEVVADCLIGVDGRTLCEATVTDLIDANVPDEEASHLLQKLAEFKANGVPLTKYAVVENFLPGRSNLADVTEPELAAVLKMAQLGNYTDRFAGIDGETLGFAQMSDLTDAGVPPSDAELLLKKIEKFKIFGVPPPTPPTLALHFSNLASGDEQDHTLASSPNDTSTRESPSISLVNHFSQVIDPAEPKDEEWDEFSDQEELTVIDDMSNENLGSNTEETSELDEIGEGLDCVGELPTRHRGNEASEYVDRLSVVERDSAELASFMYGQVSSGGSMRELLRRDMELAEQFQSSGQATNRSKLTAEGIDTAKAKAGAEVKQQKLDELNAKREFLDLPALTELPEGSTSGNPPDPETVTQQTVLNTSAGQVIPPWDDSVPVAEQASAEIGITLTRAESLQDLTYGVLRKKYTELIWEEPPSGWGKPRLAGEIIKAETALLPQGWVQSEDPASGHTYYYNTVTHASQWTRPARLPLGWTEAVDPTSGNIYFTNTTTGVSQWEFPQSATQMLATTTATADRRDQFDNNFDYRLFSKFPRKRVPKRQSQMLVIRTKNNVNEMHKIVAEGTAFGHEDEADEPDTPPKNLQRTQSGRGRASFGEFAFGDFGSHIDKRRNKLTEKLTRYEEKQTLVYRTPHPEISTTAGRQGSKVGAKLSTPKNVLSEDHNVERLRKHNEEKSGAVRKQSGSSNSGRKLRVSPGVAKFTWHE